jgi:hypothetical protein
MSLAATAKQFVTVHLLRILGALLAAAVLFAAIQTVRIEGVWCSDAGPTDKPSCLIRGFKQEVQVLRFALNKETARADSEAAKHLATKQAYRDAQAEAAELEAQRLARVVARQEKITDEVASDYRQRIVALNARVERLRAQVRSGEIGSGAAGAAGGEPMPGAGDPASGIDEAPDCQRFPAADPLTDLECRRIATEQATQLSALIAWVGRQLKVQE